MRKDLLVVNFKAYSESSGEHAVALSKIAESVSKKTGIPVILAVQSTDIALITSSVQIPVFAQHVDPNLPGAKTGSVTIESVTQAGACGSILNHSEKRLDLIVLKDTLAHARNAGFPILLCAKDAAEAKSFSLLNPDFIAIEPPELIGGNVSVSTARPNVISDGVKAVGGIPLLVGAGIKTQEDVRIAKKLGARGILVASGVVLANNPKKVLLDLARGFE